MCCLLFVVVVLLVSGVVWWLLSFPFGGRFQKREPPAKETPHTSRKNTLHTNPHTWHMHCIAALAAVCSLVGWWCCVGWCVCVVVDAHPPSQPTVSDFSSANQTNTTNTNSTHTNTNTHARTHPILDSHTHLYPLFFRHASQSLSGLWLRAEQGPSANTKRDETRRGSAAMTNISSKARQTRPHSHAYNTWCL